MIFSRRAPRDPVADNLRTLAKQGRGMARVAHLFAGLLIVLFSAASFIALGSEALARFQASMARGAFDLPDAISLAVVVLIVPAFDWGMLYAAHRVNLLITRKADRKDMRVHVGVIVLATLVEGASYIYMSIMYEHPATIAAWAIIVIRGLSAPLLAVYLAMARALPVTPRDILYQGELAAGAGVLRDVALAANDQSAPLAQKMALYGAAAEMRPADRGRLDAMIAAVQRQTGERIADPLDAYPRPLPNGFPPPTPVTPPGGWHPTNGGSPAGMPILGYSSPDYTTFPGTQAWESVAEEAGSLTGTRAVATAAPMSGNSAERAAQQAYVNTYLDRLPLTSRTALREHLRIRYEDAREMYNTWFYQYGGAAKIEAAKAEARERSAQVAQ